MNLLEPLRRLILKSVLRSALQLEEQIYGLFAALPEELEGVELPPSLRHIIAEEQEHQRLLRDMIDGRLPEAEVGRLLAGSGPLPHDPARLRPLPKAYGRVIERLQPILEHEEHIWRFFSSLAQESHLRPAKQAFTFLADQEQIHVRMLRRLLGKPDIAEV